MAFLFHWLEGLQTESTYSVNTGNLYLLNNEYSLVWPLCKFLNISDDRLACCRPM